MRGRTNAERAQWKIWEARVDDRYDYRVGFNNSA